MHLGKSIRLERIFNRKTGRTIIVPLDHGVSVGPIFGIVDLRDTVNKVADGGANAVLMHFVAVSAYFLDGFAFAAEALVGKAVGAAHRAGLSKASRMTTWWAAWVALFSSLLLIAFGPSLVNILTVEPDVRALAREFLPWAALAPLAGVWCFQLDGIFIGATRTAAMRNAMLMSLAIFLIAWYLLTPFGNNGLWAALYVHYAARTGTLLYFFPALQRSVPV